jgi:putative endonuclease
MTATARVADAPAAPEPSARSALGRRGEDLAARHLEEQGLVLLSRNWRCRDGELDLIATDGERLVICEVKTRSGTGFGVPAEAVTAAKMHRIRRLAQLWLSTYRVGWCEVRFDIISVLWPPDGPVQIEHLRGAF